MPTEDLVAAEAAWWESILEAHEDAGAADAVIGKYEPPYPGSNDPQDEEENEAYDNGFKRARRDLGDSFKWAQVTE